MLTMGAVVLFGGAIALSLAPRDAGTDAASAGANVSMEDGVQVITLSAKGGYRPQTTVAKAGIRTILRFETRGTFDCSSAVRIPALGIDRTLPVSGTTDIDVGGLQPGVLEGTCSMGMYRFSVDARE